MNILKKIILVLITPLFSFLLFATAIDYGFVHTASHPATIKKLVADSGVYKDVAPSILAHADNISTTVGDLSASDPAVKSAANAALSPAFVLKDTESALDSVYAWLDGKTTQPTFSVDLTGVKTGFADSLSASVEQRLASLPRCTSASQVSSVDLVNASCLPAGVTPQAAAAQIKDSLNNGSFIDQTKLSASDIKNGDSNQSVFANQNVPKNYQRAKKTPYILGLLSVLVAAAIVFLSAGRRRGVRRVAITLLVIGVLMMVFSWVLNKLIVGHAIPKIQIQGNPLLQTDIRNLATDLAQLIDKNYWFFGSIYSVIGAASLGWLWYSGRSVAPKFPAKKPAAKQPADGSS